MKKRLLSLLLPLALLMSLLVSPAQAASVTGSGLLAATQWSGDKTGNRSANNYTVRASVVNSYLSQSTDGTYTRVQYVKNTGVVIETYSAEGTAPLSSKTISAPLGLFGGFYCGESYNYLVFGQPNRSEDDSVEIMRVVKYDKSWNELGYYSACGANTNWPFDAGSLRMVEAGGYLYVYTCHTMYTSSDGRNHQANMTYKLNISDMSLSSCYYGIMNYRYGYVSHSFNQFIQTDGTDIYRVDHGDAHPRGIYISRTPVNKGVTQLSAYTTVMTIQGTSGANNTGVSVGGFALSGSNCLIAGNSVDQSDADTYKASGQRNIFVTVTPKSFTTQSSNTTTVWLTSYTSEDGVSPKTPQLVKLSNDAFMVLWEEYSNSTKQTSVRVAMIDGSGKLTGKGILSVNARLSDCQPILAMDGTVTWYVADDSTLIRYAIDPTTAKTLTQNTVTVAGAENGSVVADTTLAAEKDTVTLTVKPKSQYQLKTISAVTASGATVSLTKVSDTTYTFTMPAAAVTVSAVFEQIPYAVATVAATGGRAATDVQTAVSGQTVTVTAAADAGYQVSGVKVRRTGGGIVNVTEAGNGVYTFTMPAADVTVTPSFTRASYSISSVQGTGSCLYTDRTTATMGATVTIYAYAEAGYTIDGTPQVTTASGKSVAVASTGSLRYTFTMPAENVTVTADYAKSLYTVTAASAQGGMIRTDRLSAGYGDTVTITPTPDAGYQIYGVTVRKSNGSSVAVSYNQNGTYSFVMPDGAVTVTPSFTAIPYNVNTASSGNGSVTVSKGSGNYSTLIATVNTTITISVSPDSGWVLSGTPVVTASGGSTVSVTRVSDTTYTFTMPAAAVTVFASFTQKGTTPSEPGQTTQLFDDVRDPAEYYYTPVYWAVENGITNGVGDNLFDPEGSCTRAQIVTFLWRYAGKPEPASTVSPFTDVQNTPETQWYYKAVLWAAEKGITTGTTETTFEPDATCTRCQIVTFLWRYEGKPSAAAQVYFSDISGNDYYYAAVQWAVENRITNGVGENRFAPEENCTRGQAVTFLYRDAFTG